jgi:hypothetical protein
VKPTVAQGLTDRPVPEGQERQALNGEVIPVLGAVRDAVNFEASFKTVVTSADSPGAPKRLWESDRVPADGAWRIEFVTVGITHAAAKYVVADRRQLWGIAAGVPTSLDDTPVQAASSGLGAPTLAFDSAAGIFYVEATDDGSGAATWTTVVRVIEVVL